MIRHRYTRLNHLWRFIKPDLCVVIIGVLLHALIGGTYPAIGAIMADVNAVCAQLAHCKLSDIHNIIGFQ